MRVAADTNVLAYAAGLDDLQKRDQAISVLGRAFLDHQLVFPAQVLAELFRLLVRKARMPAADARADALRWRGKGLVVPTSESTLELGFNLAVAHRMQAFDAIILAAAAEAGCRILLSEDMQHGFTWGGVTVVNPFADTPHPLLADL